MRSLKYSIDTTAVMVVIQFQGKAKRQGGYTLYGGRKPSLFERRAMLMNLKVIELAVSVLKLIVDLINLVLTVTIKIKKQTAATTNSDGFVTE